MLREVRFQRRDRYPPITRRIDIVDRQSAAEHTAVLRAAVPIRLGKVQAPGKKLMNAVDWARGARLEPSVRAS